MAGLFGRFFVLEAIQDQNSATERGHRAFVGRRLHQTAGSRSDHQRAASGHTGITPRPADQHHLPVASDQMHSTAGPNREDLGAVLRGDRALATAGLLAVFQVKLNHCWTNDLPGVERSFFAFDVQLADNRTDKCSLFLAGRIDLAFAFIGRKGIYRLLFRRDGWRGNQACGKNRCQGRCAHLGPFDDFHHGGISLTSGVFEFE